MIEEITFIKAHPSLYKKTNNSGKFIINQTCVGALQTKHLIQTRDFYIYLLLELQLFVQVVVSVQF